MENQTNPSKGNARLLLFRRNVARLRGPPRVVAGAIAVVIFWRLPGHNLLRVIAAIGRQRQLFHQLPSLARQYAGHIVRSTIARYRPLLAREPAELSLKERIERRLLNRFLEIPDARYRRALAGLDAQLKGRCVSDAKNPIALRRGVMMMIGTLGPGGAERQLVITAAACARSPPPGRSGRHIPMPRSPPRAP